MIDGTKVGSVKVLKIQPSVFSADETANVGKDTETMAPEDYTAESSKFTGKISKVTINLKESVCFRP